MKRNSNDVVTRLNELFDELAHNYAVKIARGNDDEFVKYLIERIYECLNSIETDLDD